MLYHESAIFLRPGAWGSLKQLPKQNLTPTCSPEATSSIFDRGRSKKLSIKSPSTKPIVGSVFLSLEKARQVEKLVKALLNSAVILITVNFSLVPARKPLHSLAQSPSDRCRQNRHSGTSIQRTSNRCNEVLDIANDFLYPSNSKTYEKEPRWNETSL